MKFRSMFLFSIFERPSRARMILSTMIYIYKYKHEYTGVWDIQAQNGKNTERHTFVGKLQHLSTLASSTGRNHHLIENL